MSKMEWRSIGDSNEGEAIETVETPSVLELNKANKTTTFEGLLGEHQLMNFQERVAHGCLECYHKLPNWKSNLK